VSFLAGMYVSVLLLAYLSRIPCGFFLKRTWVFVPLFSLLLAIPAVFEAVTPGERIAVFSVGPWEAAVTRQGAMSALRLLSRVTVSVSLAVLLVLTTPHTLLLKGMRVCAVPALFVETAMLCHRYLFFFVELVQNVFLGIKSRCGAGLAARTGREVVGSGIAHLWQRSVQLQEQVYQAMRSRGYSGEPRTEGEPPPSRGDWAWAGAMLLLCAVVSVLGVTGRL
jgi:cobalt/nickel transport system permease protein